MGSIKSKRLDWVGYKVKQDNAINRCTILPVRKRLLDLIDKTHGDLKKFRYMVLINRYTLDR